MYRLFAICLSMMVCAGYAGEVTGTVKVTNRRGKPLKISKDQVIVFLEKEGLQIPGKVVGADYIMSTSDKQFSPRVMAVPTGATVRFPNNDPILHNAFSVSKPNKFDVGQYGEGEGATHTFEHPGLVRVYCNVHHSMNAVIYVCDTPYFTYAADDGTYRFTDVPPGEYTLAAFHRIGGLKKVSVTVTKSGIVTTDLEIASKRKKLKPHRNKHGKPYKRRKSERY